MKTRKAAKSFRFKQFSVTTGNCGMPVSTDSVLLGAWVTHDNPQFILDIGTGSGILALMCAQRFSTSSGIIALDIDDLAIQAASFNVQQSPWQERIDIRHQDILTFEPNHHVDVIVCNPPYFNTGQTAAELSRATARHTLHLSHIDLIHHCHRLLKSTGRANFILPFTEGQQFIEAALKSNWYLSRYCLVRPTESKPPHRILFELSLTPVEHPEMTQLTIRENQSYSEEFTRLTKDFYLKM